MSCMIKLLGLSSVTHPEMGDASKLSWPFRKLAEHLETAKNLERYAESTLKGKALQNFGIQVKK